MTPIAVAPLTSVTMPSSAAHPAAGKGNASFGQLVAHAVHQLGQTQTAAHQAMQAAFNGHASLTQVMVSMTQAQSTLDVATAVRNGAVQAYQSIMNMPLG